MVGKSIKKGSGYGSGYGDGSGSGYGDGYGSGYGDGEDAVCPPGIRRTSTGKWMTAV